mgnify:CR=1 FL=1
MIKLLHVEDDPDILEIALLSLEISSEFDVLQCDNGPEALNKAVAFGPDVLLLDVMMPGMSGIQLLDALRKFPELSQTPAIFMTARAQASERREMMLNGAVGVIVKPFDPMSLADEIKTILSRS